MSSAKSKRPDIQSLRCLAVFAVIAFHLRPDLFPFGYLGVDIFFVLSGYLMSLMMSRVSVINAKSVLDFYWRRISRILPMYGVVIFTVVGISRFILAPIDYRTLVRDTRWSLVFGANIQQYVDGSDYWAQVNDSPILLHMWSLGAEVQYYLIVPLIIMLQRCFARRDQQLMFLGSLTIVSFLSFVIFTMSNEAGAFLLMPNRAWQFIIGSIAFKIDAQKEVSLDDAENVKLISCEKEHISTTRIIAIITIVLSLMCFSPLQVPIRFPVSIFTALLLFFGSLKEVELLSNQYIVKLGNASYVLYLVHWPVITLYKYSQEVTNLDIIGVLTCFTVALVVSLLLHENIELRMLGAFMRTIIIVVGSLYAATLLMTSIDLRVTIDNDAAQKYNLTEVVDWNTYKTGHIGLAKCTNEGGVVRCGSRVYRASSVRHVFSWQMRPERAQITYFLVKLKAKLKAQSGNHLFISHTHSFICPAGNGTARILILGNSFANLVIEHLHPWLHPIAKEIRLFTHHGCRLLDEHSCTPEYPKYSTTYSSDWPRVVERMKPDVTWIISSDLQLIENPLVHPIQNDPTLVFLKDRLDFISKHSKLVVLDYQSAGKYLSHTFSPPVALLRKISQQNFNFSNLKVAEQDWIKFDRNERIRMENIDNPKLIRHKISEHQCKEGICYYYNPANLHTYYSDSNGHPTSELMAMLAPSYKGVIEQLKKRLNL